MILAEVFKDKELHVCNLLKSNSAKKKKKPKQQQYWRVCVRKRKKGKMFAVDESVWEKHRSSLY